MRGIKVKIAKVPIPVSYGSAFEGERVRKEAMYAEFGGKRTRAFEYLRMRPADEVEDGKVTSSAATSTRSRGAARCRSASSSTWPAARCRPTSSPSSSASSTTSSNGAEGIQHNGQRDITWIRVSDGAYEKGFRLEHLRQAPPRPHPRRVRQHRRQGAGDAAYRRGAHGRVARAARAAYKERNERIATLTDESVDIFYSCLLCQSFAPNHVCVVNPERVGLCGAYNWLDCKASYEINPTGPNQPVPKGVIVDAVKGEFSGPNEFIYQHSNQSVERVTFYSIMEAPMTSCGCFECIMVLVPEANGFMIVSREDPSMTPSGMTFSTLAGTAGGGLQTPGMMGMGKFYLTSDKFISGRRRHRAHRLDELLPQAVDGRSAAHRL